MKKRQKQDEKHSIAGVVSPRQILERIVIGELAIALMAELAQFTEDARAQLNRMHDSAKGMVVPKARQAARKPARAPKMVHCKEPGCKQLSKGPRFARYCALHAAKYGYTGHAKNKTSKSQQKRIALQKGPRTKAKARRSHTNGQGQVHATA